MQRERIEPGAIVARFAQSWLRIGTFDLLRARGDRALIRRLATYVAEDVFGGWESLPARVEHGQTDLGHQKPRTGLAGSVVEGAGVEEENRFVRLYRHIVRRNALTVAAWQTYGFMNGVLNTDNTSLMGLSIDFGPFAFLDNFDPDYTPNHDDQMLRYSYRNQPTVIWWNLIRLGEALVELMGAGAKVDNEDLVRNGVSKEAEAEVVKRAETIIRRVGQEYQFVFLAEYQRLMMARVGLKTEQTDDLTGLFGDLLDTMEALELDFNHFFRKLSNVTLADVKTAEARQQIAQRFFHHEGITAVGVTEKEARERIGVWLERWRDRVVQDWGNDSSQDDERAKQMKAMNPKVSRPPSSSSHPLRPREVHDRNSQRDKQFIPRSWILDEVIQRVERQGERDVLRRVMHMSLHPFEDSWGQDVEEEERFCGDVPRPKRAMQCSCSS